MLDITKKIKTHRLAIAQAIVKVSRQETIDAVKNKSVPKGDVLEASRIAGLFGIKRTSDMIPDCHPMPVEFAAIRHKIDGLEIKIETEVHTIYRTGVEVEAMHGASVAALTVYDMLKPIDKKIEITSIKLIEKKGGKSDFTDTMSHELRASVIVCSDSISAGKKHDQAGKAIIAKLESLNIKTSDYIIIPDEQKIIRDRVEALCKLKNDLIIITGGTGLSSRDVAPESVKPLIDREIPGVMEAARSYGQERTPYSMLSRGIAGLKGNTLILTLPGSTNGAAESMDALFPYILHVFKIIHHARHD